MKKFLIVGFGSIGKRYYKIMNDLFKKKNVIDVIDNNSQDASIILLNINL